MEEIKITHKKKEALHTINWQEIYVLTEHWLSDMEFYRDEINFLNNLIDKYFVLMTKQESKPKVRKMLDNLSSLSKKQHKLSERFHKHLADLGLLREKALNGKSDWFRDEHVSLEDDLSSFVKEFRTIKKELFNITEHIMESERLKHLLPEH